MTLRQQLPVYSPLSIRGLGTGLAAGLLGGDGKSRVLEWIQSAWHPRAAILTNSGTTALTLAMRSGAPGAIALPAYGCYDLATAADGAATKVLLYDLDPLTLSPEPASLERAMAQGAGAVVLVHYYGIPADLSRVTPTIGSNLIIEDAAQGAGGTHRDRPLGGIGSLAVLSFGRGKGMTGGGGGAILANDERGQDLARGIEGALEPSHRGMGAWFRTLGQWALSRPSLYWLPASLPFVGLGETAYHAPGATAGLADVSAGILSRTAALTARETATRQRNARRLLQAAGGLSGLRSIGGPADGVSGYLRLPFVASPEARRAASTLAARRLGIMPGYPRPLHHLVGFESRIINRNEAFPGAELLADRLITLPTHSLLAERDLVALEGWIKQW